MAEISKEELALRKQLEKINQAAEILKCKRDVFYFIENYVKIEDRDSEEIAIPFILWEEQKIALGKFLTDKLVQVLKARQLGLTWLALAFICWKQVFNGGFSTLALSKTDNDAKELVRRVKFILNNLPEWMIKSERDWTGTASTVTIISHKDNSVFQSFPASEDSGRSFTGNVLYEVQWEKI